MPGLILDGALSLAGAPWRCKICGEYLGESPMVFAQFLYRVNPHYETVHPDYVAWLGPYRRNLYAISTSLIIIFGVTGLLSLSQGGVYIYISWIAGLLFAVFGVYETWNLQRTLKQYAQAWNEKKGASLPN